MSTVTTDSKTLVMGMLASDAFTMVNKRLLRAFGGDGTLAIVLCELLGVYKYMMANHQVDPLGAFPLPVHFLEKTMGLSSSRQNRALQTLSGGGLLILSKMGMPATRHVALNFDNIAQLLLEEANTSGAQKSSAEFYKTLSAATVDDMLFEEALDNIKDPLRGAMVLLTRSLRGEGCKSIQWSPQNVGQLKIVTAYYSKRGDRFDYQMMIDLLNITKGATVSARIASMLKYYKQIIQRAPEERKYVY